MCIRDSLRTDHVAVIRRQNQVGLQRGNPLDPLGRVDLLRSVEWKASGAGHRRGGLEPDLFVGIVLVRDERDHVVTAGAQRLEAGMTDLTVTKKQDAGLRHGELLSLTARRDTGGARCPERAQGVLRTSRSIISCYFIMHNSD